MFRKSIFPGVYVCGILFLLFLPASSRTQQSSAVPTPLGRLVNVDGHLMHINCMGKGTPTVILEAGVGAFSFDWGLVQPEIAKFTRVCSYDRAGAAWSELGPNPRTIRQKVHELHTLLTNAGISGPLLLVGHSGGGFVIRQYQAQYPKVVVGMVLVECGHEDSLVFLDGKPEPLISLGPRDDREMMTQKQQQQRGRWLLGALQNERIARAIELIRQGADLCVRSPDGRTALYTALAYGCFAVVTPLLEAGADPNMPGPYGTYPIHLAAAYGQEEAPHLLETLIAHGARIDVRDDEGATAIFLAGKSASAETVSMLLRHGANINDRNNELDTALTFVCCWGRTERAAMLLDAGIDLEAQDDSGMTALHWAASNGHVSTVNLLLNRGAYVNVATRWGRTALMYAAAHGSLRCVTSLLEAGADPVTRDENGQTALDDARRYAGRDLAKALLADETVSRVDAGGEQMFVERFSTPDGEPAVRIGAAWGNGAGWTRENCDGFDAIVPLLQQDLPVTGLV